MLCGKNRTAEESEVLIIHKKINLCVLAYLSEDLLIDLRILRKRVMECETLFIVFSLYS